MNGMRINMNSILPNRIKSDLVQKKEVSTGFTQILAKAIDGVNNAQKESDIMGEKLAVGDIDNLHDVQIATQKAELTLNLMVQVRNKVLDAYNDINRIQF